MLETTTPSTLDRFAWTEGASRATDHRLFYRSVLMFAECLSLGILYYLMVAISMRLRFATSGLSLIWPSNALLVGTLALRPKRRWWAYLLAASFAHVAAMSPYHTSLPWLAYQMVFNSAEATACATLLQRFGPAVFSFDTLKAVFTFLAVSIAVPGVMNLVAMYPVVRFSSSAPRLAHNWYGGIVAMSIAGWINNTASLIAFVPTILVTATRGRSWLRDVSSRRAVQGALVAIVFGTLTFLVYRAVYVSGNLQQAVYLVPIPLLLWIVVRFGPAGTCLSLTALVCISTWATYAGEGAFLQSGSIEHAIAIQVSWIMICAPMLALAALVLERKLATLASLASEGQFRQLFEQATVGVAIESIDGHVHNVNPAFCLLSGYTEDELHQMTWRDFSSHANQAEYRLESRLLNELTHGRGSSYQLERRFQRKDGVERWGSVRVSLLKQPGGEPPMVIRLVEDVTDKKSAAEALFRAHAELRQLTPRLLQAQEDERRRIARELHDDISQRLAVLTIEMEQLKQGERGVDGDFREKLRELSRQAMEISHNVHAMSHELHSSKLEYLDLVTAAGGYCKEAAAQQKIQVDFSVHGVLPVVSYDISLCLFRVLQEALRNAVKHSGVRRFVVKLHGMPGEVGLSVSDSGVGFAPDDKQLGRGLGLVSMRERVRAVGGVISIASKLAGGTTIFARIPVDSVRPVGQGTGRDALATRRN